MPGSEQSSDLIRTRHHLSRLDQHWGDLMVAKPIRDGNPPPALNSTVRTRTRAQTARERRTLHTGPASRHEQRTADVVSHGLVAGTVRVGRQLPLPFVNVCHTASSTASRVNRALPLATPNRRTIHLHRQARAPHFTQQWLDYPVQRAHAPRFYERICRWSALIRCCVFNHGRHDGRNPSTHRQVVVTGLSPPRHQ